MSSAEQQDYQRILAEDTGNFSSNVVEPKIEELRDKSPVLLALQYPSIGNPYATGSQTRLQFSGRTGHLYREIRFSHDNAHFEGYDPKEIENKPVLVAGLFLSRGIVDYLRPLRDEHNADSVYFAFRLPYTGILTLEEIEEKFSV